MSGTSVRRTCQEPAGEKRTQQMLDSRCLIADGDIEVHVQNIARVRWPILPRYAAQKREVLWEWNMQAGTRVRGEPD
ncbi:hypothetical protein VFPPC_16938 [Pochonia chlamydosporia 170]|uniref:Uncharacterized protein n=1 Tax=Pochonia chlamydosporia 170 TaxID=1380566 RepID=A0A179EZP4_METCM|nr:hypothetical protein VFPPC_16938 [Pochonia chlamydosporia 170]OAQ58664.1 hypothetical protein VFPPC_16938 [Pochonia chlamydosporia 170]